MYGNADGRSAVSIGGARRRREEQDQDDRKEVELGQTKGRRQRGRRSEASNIYKCSISFGITIFSGSYFGRGRVGARRAAASPNGVGRRVPAIHGIRTHGTVPGTGATRFLRSRPEALGRRRLRHTLRRPGYPICSKRPGDWNAFWLPYDLPWADQDEGSPVSQFRGPRCAHHPVRFAPAGPVHRICRRQQHIEQVIEVKVLNAAQLTSALIPITLYVEVRLMHWCRIAFLVSDYLLMRPLMIDGTLCNATLWSGSAKSWLENGHRRRSQRARPRAMV